nr:immunoglobulin light chain junction region [Macaca mulatta]
CQQHGYPPTF